MNFPITHPSFPAQRERVTSGRCEPMPLAIPGIELREFASGACGATGLCTGTASFAPEAFLAYHTHPFSEVITVLDGQALVSVEGRSYLLSTYDCIHVPAHIAHSVRNPSHDSRLTAHYTFASEFPSRVFVEDRFSVQPRMEGLPEPGNPEFLLRFGSAEVYELSPGAYFRDLFASRFGAKGVCGGYGLFRPGASLPCHFHVFDESITVVTGSALCLVEGSRYFLSGHDTAFVPKGRVHRFKNVSNEDMAMIWVYAGSEPERTIVENCRCDETDC